MRVAFLFSMYDVTLIYLEAMNNTSDLARRFPENPLLRPADIQPSRPDWQVECLLNPGVFRFNGKTCLLVRVAERPPPREGYVSFPILSESGEAKVLEFDRKDPRLDISDPRVLRYEGAALSDHAFAFADAHERRWNSFPRRHVPIRRFMVMAHLKLSASRTAGFRNWVIFSI